MSFLLKSYKKATYLILAFLFPLFFIGVLELFQGAVQLGFDHFIKGSIDEIIATLDEIGTNPQTVNFKYRNLLGEEGIEIEDQIKASLEKIAILQAIRFVDPASQAILFEEKKPSPSVEFLHFEKEIPSLFGETLLVIEADVNVKKAAAFLNYLPVSFSFFNAGENVYWLKRVGSGLKSVFLLEHYENPLRGEIYFTWLHLFLLLCSYFILCRLLFHLKDPLLNKVKFFSRAGGVGMQEKELVTGIMSIRHDLKRIKKNSNSSQLRSPPYRSSKLGPTKVKISEKQQKKMMENLIQQGKKTALVQDPTLKKEIIFNFGYEDNIEEITLPKDNLELEKSKQTFKAGKTKAIETKERKKIDFNKKYKNKFIEIRHSYQS